MKELQNLYEAILDVNFDRCNFYNKMKRFEILAQPDEHIIPIHPRKRHISSDSMQKKYNELKREKM